MNRVLVSACLVGEKVRYDGKDKRSVHPVLERWLGEGRVVRVCPEVEGGLGIPRPPAEIRDGRVVTKEGRDVNDAFAKGASIAVQLAQQYAIKVAVLKEGSPSCGSSHIGDGTFSKVKIPGAGRTTEALRAIGVQVFSEAQWDEAFTAVSAGD